LELQALLVPPILPHDRAEASNAVWNLKEGALYGFFPVTGSRDFSFEALVVSKVPPDIQYCGCHILKRCPCRFPADRRDVIELHKYIRYFRQARTL
jgi:hypothetical protein